jgi:gas vesicle protein
MSQRDGFTGGFLAGAIVGGLVGGVLGTVLANRSRRSLGDGDNQAFLEEYPQWALDSRGRHGNRPPQFRR